ncbi:hypothetical protein [Pseudomonas syringae group sp. J254-4]|uniref:hypothetical protein n=1 Tax=Pseudomonas syringae group sp. J254-4 TaxID=3079589 RepID=UPI002913D71C|nr:hypothetical protein [Pseudomonas syringae group sp. J254-4]MDU8456767.1 hypothetical protein [Pseudomonas syringae group sp. J254-4]
MKAVVFTVLALASATASAETINITSELTHNGQLVSNFSAGVENGKQQRFRDVSLVDYTESATEKAGVVKRHKAQLETGFQMTLVPRITSTGDISYQVTASNQKLISMEKSQAGRAVIDVPHTVSNSFTQTRIAKNGEPVDFPFGASGADSGYVLTIKGTHPR